MLPVKKREDHAEEGEESRIDFAWLTFIGMQMGYTEKEISRMYFGKWNDMFVHFKWYHNFRAKRCIFEERKRVPMLDL